MFKLEKLTLPEQARVVTALNILPRDYSRKFKNKQDLKLYEEREISKLASHILEIFSSCTTNYEGLSNRLGLSYDEMPNYIKENLKRLQLVLKCLKHNINQMENDVAIKRYNILIKYLEPKNLFDDLYIK